jgi:predicted RNA binding protein YcfA (HicA-like mRNA interferase family)
MTKKQKLLQRLRQNPKNVRFEEIDSLLLALGFEKRQRGSHVTYIYQQQTRMTIPIRKPFILPVYVKDILKLLDESGIADVAHES